MRLVFWTAACFVALSLTPAPAFAQNPPEGAPSAEVAAEAAPDAIAEPPAEPVAEGVVEPVTDGVAEPVPEEEAAPEEEAEVVEAPSAFTFGLITSLFALSLGGISAVLGIWVDRDKSRPMTFALAMSVLISSAVCVGMFQGVLDSRDAIAAKADLSRMLDMVNEIAFASGDPALAALVAEEGGTAIEIPPAPPAPPPEPEPVEDAVEDAAEGAVVPEPTPTER